ncbi:Meckelin [Sergentomyia squamirostris]
MRLPISLMVIISVGWSINIVTAEENTVFLYRSVESCKKDEYFDVNYLKCKKCESELNLVPSKDRVTCECFPRELERIEYDNVLQQSICDRKCKKLSNETTTCHDDTPCGLHHVNQTNLSHQSRHVQILRAYRTSSNCSCNYKHSSLYRNTFCIPNHLLKDYANYGHYRVGSVTEDLMYLTFFCHTLKRWQECNHLANLCTLSLYSLDRPSACFLFFATQTSDITSTNDLSEKTSPSLFYRRGRSSAEELDKVLDFSFDTQQDDVVNFTTLQFTLDGHLTKFHPVNVLRELNLCPTSRDRILFGQSFTVSCQISMYDLVSDKNPDIIFTQLFVNYIEKKMPLIRSIPVLIRNSSNTNADDNPEGWQLVRRFFTLDLISGLRSGYRSKLYENDKLQDKYDYIRYITKAELRFNIKTDNNKLSTPLLILTYGEYNFTQKDMDSKFDFQFSVVFKKDYDFQYLLEILLPLFILLAFVLAIFEAIAYKTRQNKLFYDIDVFGKFCVFLLSKVGTALFITVIIISLYVHFTYKRQKQIRLLVPLAVENLLVVLTGIALAFKTIKLLQHLWQIAHIDIFFIDWERPRIFENRNQLDTPSVCSGSVGTRLASPCESISAWRSYFVANEWQELTTTRKISMFIHLMGLLWLLLLVKFDNFASTKFYFHLWPAPDDPPDGILLTSTAILAYSSVYILQRIFNFLIWQRYVKNPLQQFIDVCCVANVSVFILRLESYGYYIHGRSPHGFSDTDICSMILQFRQEERGQRGLTPGSELQTYSLLAPKNLRIFYDRLILPLQHPPMVNEYTTKGYEGNFERTILTYYSINRFFGAFIDHALKDLDYIVKEKTILEKMLNCEFEAILSENKGIFYVDNEHSFDEILFYGSEFLLFQFEIILFTFIVAITHNFLLAGITVGVVYQILKFSVNLLTKHNLAKKTLIDQRFLM